MTLSLVELMRPRTRGDCLQEARPCPWVSCPHHLLIEVVSSKRGRASSLRMRAAGSSLPTLRPSSAAALVDVWIDEAVEMLTRMEHTCALDAAEDGSMRGREQPGRGPTRIAALLVTTKRQVVKETRPAIAKVKARFIAAGLDQDVRSR